MNDQRQENVQHYRREELEPEIAAMSVAIEAADKPIVIVNIDDPTAKHAIKKVIVWLGTITGIGWLVEWAQRSFRQHLALAMAGTATVATAATVAVTEMVRDGMEPRPPSTAQQVVTIQPPPITVTASPRYSQPASPPPTTAPEHSRIRPTEPARQSRAVRTPSRPAAEPARPSKTPPRATEPATPTQAAQLFQQAEAVALPPPSADTEPPPVTATPTQPEPDLEPSPEPEPAPQPVATTDGDCGGLAVVLDPLLDLCLLG